MKRWRWHLNTFDTVQKKAPLAAARLCATPDSLAPLSGTAYCVSRCERKRSPRVSRAVRGGCLRDAGCLCGLHSHCDLSEGLVCGWQAIASEWERQPKLVSPASMPINKLATTVCSRAQRAPRIKSHLQIRIQSHLQIRVQIFGALLGSLRRVPTFPPVF